MSTSQHEYECEAQKPEKHMCFSDKYYYQIIEGVKFYYSTTDNSYVGDLEFVNKLEKLGIILVQKAIPTDNAASIGFDPKNNRWYGWSHRAIFSYGLGDVVKPDSAPASSGLIEEYRVQHPEEDYSLPVGYKAETLNDAKRIAIAFAKAVS